MNNKLKVFKNKKLAIILFISLLAVFVPSSVYAVSTASLSGTVVNSKSEPLEGITVNVFDQDYIFVKDTDTDIDGKYSLDSLDSGSYYLSFDDYNDAYISEFYDSKQWDTATIINLASGQHRNNINAQLDLGGSISGKVTNSSNVGLDDILVEIYDENGSYENEGFTDSSGNYHISLLKEGSYRLKYYEIDWLENFVQKYISEFYNDKNTLQEANSVLVVPGEDLSGVNVQLANVPQPAPNKIPPADQVNPQIPQISTQPVQRTILNTFISLATNKKSIKAGKSVSISGTLKNNRGEPLVGKQVNIIANGKVIKNVTTIAGGVYSLKFKPKKTITLQATYVGDADFSSSTSNSAKVTVKKIKKKINKKKK